MKIRAGHVCILAILLLLATYGIEAKSKMSLIIESESRSGSIGEIISVPIRVNATEPYSINSFGMKAVYEPEIMRFIEVVTGDLTQDWGTVAGYENHPGLITIGAYPGAANAITDTPSGVLCEMRFEIVKEAWGQITIYKLIDDLRQFQPEVLTIQINEVFRVKKSELLTRLATKYYKVSEASQDGEPTDGFRSYLVRVWEKNGDAIHPEKLRFFVEDEGLPTETAYWSRSEPKPTIE